REAELRRIGGGAVGAQQDRAVEIAVRRLPRPALAAVAGGLPVSPDDETELRAGDGETPRLVIGAVDLGEAAQGEKIWQRRKRRHPGNSTALAASAPDTIGDGWRKKNMMRMVATISTARTSAPMLRSN